MSYRDSHKAEGKGREYHESFSSYPHRAMLWGMEKVCLHKIIKKYLNNSGEFTSLDFACGTGRVLDLVSEYVKEPVGLDVSPSMIEVAKDNVKSAKIILADITKEDALDGQIFDLITAFRFFPNAEDTLRNEVLKALVTHLSEDGILVFNNHRNQSSLAMKILKILKKGNTNGMSVAEVNQLLQAHGLVIVDKYPLAILPLTDKHMLKPRWLAEFFEGILVALPLRESMAQNIIYVCQKINSKN